jgi:hypothetical protein
MIDKEIEQIFANSVDVQKTADRLYQLTGRRFIVEEVDKNDDTFTAGAYDPPPGDDDKEDDENETETELSPRERARRQRQLAENVRETGRLESTRKDLAMLDPDVLISQVSKAGLGFTVVKHFLEKTDSDELTESQVTALLMGAWGAEFGKKFQTNDEEGRIARAAVAKARDAAWFKPPAVETGERALAATTQPLGSKNPLRERIIRDKQFASPFMDQAALERYADGMLAELERVARGKQERARPGTLTNV